MNPVRSGEAVLSFVFNCPACWQTSINSIGFLHVPGAEVATQIASRNFPGYVENRFASGTNGDQGTGRGRLGGTVP